MVCALHLNKAIKLIWGLFLRDDYCNDPINTTHGIFRVDNFHCCIFNILALVFMHTF